MNVKTPITRRGLFGSALGAALVMGVTRAADPARGRRNVVVLLNGFGPDYLERPDMPTLK